ncbi:MAG: alpha/beta fold hydrolase [Phycisphaerales bacterium]
MQSLRPAPVDPLPPGVQFAELPMMTGEGPAPAREPQAACRVAYRRWSPEGTTAGPPVLLLHGSPGESANLRDLGARLAAAGRDVIAPDLPGFGFSTRDVPSFSIRAHAHSSRALLDHLKIDRVHVVGWSMGGGVALHLADNAPRRVASLTLLGAIGDQAYEGSGSYFFEHAKYAAGYLPLVIGPRLLPHFGLLGNDFQPSVRRSFIRNFWDTDQRPLTDLMRRLKAPTLIVHGRRDFLVPDVAAERHHALIRPSRLVMLPFSHFMPLPEPMGRPGVVADQLAPFLARHDQPGVPAQRRADILAPPPRWFLGETIGAPAAAFLRGDGVSDARAPWWLVMLLIALPAMRWPRLTALVAMTLVAEVLLDLGLAAASLVLGALVRSLFLGPRASLPPAPSFNPASSPRSPVAWIRSVLLGTLRGAGIALAASIIAPTIVAPLGEAWRAPGLLIGTAPGLLALVFVTDIVTARGRREFMRACRRWRHHEFWPTWLFYFPLFPYLVWLAMRHRHPLAFLAANPGIENGGGWIEESKFRIVEALEQSGAPVLPARLIPAGASPEARAAQTLAIIHADPRFAFPVILKPDRAERGFAVALARAAADVAAYFERMHDDALLQQFHPGPHECGIMWVRHPPRAETATPALAGRIFAITAKTFPEVTGDGERPLKQLILDHPRFQCQAHVFLTRHAHQLDRVLAPGQTLRLAQAGNHCQGTMFADGSALITPRLEAAIDRIASAFPGGFDFGRFDLRFASASDLADGRGLAIIELNGTSSEATALYDPNRSLLWAYRLLFRQWAALFALGAARMREGRRPPGFLHMLRLVRRHYATRAGSPVSD